MKTLILLLSSRTTFFILTTLTILTLNLFPLISHIRHAPPGRNFAMIHNNVQDFFFYQALMNEGGSGAWLTTDPYTTESHQPSIIFSYFLGLGKLSKLLGLSYALTYHITRIILGIIFLYTAYYLLNTVLKVPHPRFTYLFFLFASPLMNGDKPYMNWWTGMDAIRRVAYLPHHMAGSLLLVITVILLIKKRYLFAIAIAPILAFIHTPSLFILLITLPPAVVLFFILHTKYQILNTKFIGLLTYWLIGLFFMFLMISQTRSGFPWSQYIDWEKNLQFPLNRELIGALGILFPFSIIGAVSAVRSRKFVNILIACWLFIPILMIPFAQKLNISNIRLIQGAPYLPLSILSIYGIQGIVARISNFKFQISNLFVYLFICLFAYFTLPTLSWSLKDQIREYWPIYGNVYLDDRLNNAFSFINQNFPSKTNTLSTFYTGNYLPAFTKTVSFIGHFGYTYNMKEKEQLVLTFLENKMTDEQAIEFLKNNKITLIFQGSEEKPIYNGYLYPNLLQPVYDKEEVTLYTLR